MIDNYINPRIGDTQLRACASNTSTSSITTSSPMAAAPVASSHPRRSTTSMSSCAHRSADAARRSLVATNVALAAHAPHARPRARRGPETWTAGQLRHYLVRFPPFDGHLP